MTVTELQEANVISVKLILNTDPTPPIGTPVTMFYGINQINDDILADFTFVDIDENGMATYTV